MDKNKSKQKNKKSDSRGQRLGFESFFRDGIRKIDLMLVLDDTENEYFEKVKVEFMINILDAGLELEMESGTLAKTSRLLFVKVHTPDHLIEEYGKNFGIFKMFRSSHTDMMRPNIKYEREWLDLIRVQYPGPENYSTMERSQITYSLLQRLQTGEADNKFGLNRLRAYNVISDVYPLHDGPFFFVDNQDHSDPNGRQVLNIGWAGYDNLFNLQPLHIIREYMGERVAFLFAFYQFYIFSQLIFVFLGGALHSLIFNDPDRKEIIARHVCTELLGLEFKIPSGTYICPRCPNFNACPFRLLKLHCKETRFKVSLDNYSIVPCTPIVCVCAIVMYYLWRRRESYLYWLWEVRESDTGNLVRAEHVVEKSASRAGLQTSTDFFLESTDQSRSSNTNTAPVLRFCVSAICILFSIFIILPFLVYLQYWILLGIQDFAVLYTDQYFHVDNIFAMILVAMTNAFLIVSFEPVLHKIAFRLAKATNPRTEDRHEFVAVVKLFGFAFFINFQYLFFVTLIKGHVGFNPLSEEDFTSLFGWKMMNCGILACIEEAIVAFVITNFAKYIFSSFYSTVKRVLTYVPTGSHVIRPVPTWEIDYCLSPLTDEVIMRKYLSLLLQFTIIFFNFSLVPLLSILPFFVNVWTIRHWATDMVRYYRRPLMLKTNGLGSFNRVLCLLPYVGAAYISLASALNSNYFEFGAYLRFILKDNRDHTEYLAATLNMLMLHYRKKKGPVYEALKQYKVSLEKMTSVSRPYCIARGASLDLTDWPSYIRSESSVQYYLFTKKVHYVVLSVVIVGLVGMICDYLIPKTPADVEDNVEAEEAYARLGFHEEHKKLK